MALYGPNDDILNDPNIQFLMGKINPAPPTLAPQPAPYAMPTAQPKPPAWLPSADAATPPANIAGPAPAPPSNVVAPAPVNQDMAGLIPTRDTQNPATAQLNQARAKYVAAQRDKNLNPRWWERLIAAASTGAQAYANGGHATPGMMEMAANINNRRRNAVLEPLGTEIGNLENQQNEWNKSEDDNYRARHDAWNSQMQVSRDRQADRRLELQDERDNARQALSERELARKEAADKEKAKQDDERNKDMDRRLDIMEKNAGNRDFSPSEKLKLSSYAREKGKKIADLSFAEVNEALGGQGGDGMSAQQKRLYDLKTRSINDKLKSNLQNRSLYMGSSKPEDLQALAAIDAENEGLYKQLDDARSEIMAGNKKEPSPNKPPKTQDKQLDEDTARAILSEAGGDKDKARKLAKQRGYSF